MQQITEGFGADVVIEAVGSPVTYVMAVDEVGFTAVSYTHLDVYKRQPCNKSV